MIIPNEAADRIMELERYESALLFLERQHSLHEDVQIIYVVDGYSVAKMSEDGQRCGPPYHGKTLLEALEKMKAFYDKH